MTLIRQHFNLMYLELIPTGRISGITDDQPDVQKLQQSIRQSAWTVPPISEEYKKYGENDTQMIAMDSAHHLDMR